MKIRLILLVTCLAIVGVIAATGYRAYVREAELSGRALAEAILQNSELAAVEAETRQLLAAAADAAIAHLDDPGPCSLGLQTLTRVHPPYAALAGFSPGGPLLVGGPGRLLPRPDDPLLRLSPV